MLSAVDSTLDFSTKNFCTPWVRDLLWVLNPEHDIEVNLTPYEKFTLPCSLDQWQALQQWLGQMDRLPQSPIDQHKRLGLYFEALLAYFFCNNPVFSSERVARNQQIFRVSQGIKTTRGELDFVLEIQGCKHGGLVHLETAVKYYLEYQLDTPQWLGPNCNDRLDKKCARLQSHQLPMAEYIDSHKPITSLYCLKGILFRRWRKQHEPSLGQDYWLPINEVEDILASSQNAWQTLEKSNWLGGNYHAGADATPAKIEQELHRKNCVMLKSVDSDQRLMVVKDCWPEISDLLSLAPL